MEFSPVKTKKFVRNVIRAAHKQAEKQQINIVKKALLEQPLNFSLDNEFNVLNKKFDNIIGSEKEKSEILNEKFDEIIKHEYNHSQDINTRLDNLMSQEKLQSYNSESLKNQIKELEHDLSTFKSEDSYMISGLKNQVKHLESELKKTEKIRSEEVHTNNIKIDDISREIIDLRKRFHDYIISKNERDLRIQNIENRIKEKVGRNYDEIIKIEDQLKILEEKLNFAKKNNKSSFIDVIESKVASLKQKLIMKKAGVDIPKIKISPITEKKNLPVIKHNLAITPVDKFLDKKDNPVVGPPKFISLPPHPIPKELPKLPPLRKPSKIDLPPPPKKDFSSFKNPYCDKSFNPPLFKKKYSYNNSPLRSSSNFPPPPFSAFDDKVRSLDLMDSVPEKKSFFNSFKSFFKK